MDELNLQKLAQLLGMMGSAHDGEALNAARAASRLLGRSGKTWPDVIGGGAALHTTEELQAAMRKAFDAGYEDGLAAAPRVSRSPPPPPPPQRTAAWGNAYGANPWSDFAREVLDHHRKQISDWEEGFLESWIDPDFDEPTEKQEAIFRRLARKTGVACPENS